MKKTIELKIEDVVEGMHKVLKNSLSLIEDSEILFLAKKSLISIREMPVSWSDGQDSKVKIIPDAFRSFLYLIKAIFK